jgi:hypothetical protein
MLQVGLLNVDGYYDALLSFIDKAVEEGFIKPTARHIMVLAPTPNELLDKLEVSTCSLPRIDSFFHSSQCMHLRSTSCLQEYSPRHEVEPKTMWETTEQLSCCKRFEIPTLKEGKAIIPAQRGSMLLP